MLWSVLYVINPQVLLIISDYLIAERISKVATHIRFTDTTFKIKQQGNWNCVLIWTKLSFYTLKFSCGNGTSGTEINKVHKLCLLILPLRPKNMQRSKFFLYDRCNNKINSWNINVIRKCRGIVHCAFTTWSNWDLAHTLTIFANKILE